jgi:4-hydroxybenzoate polyprenyltransferase
MLPDPILLSKFAVGAVVMRAAGCVINDIWDRDFDKHVERTKTRPLASGALTVKQAVALLALQLSCGLGVLVSFNINTIVVGT